MPKNRRSALVIVCLCLLWALPSLANGAPEAVQCPGEPTDMLIDYGNVVTCDVSVGDSDQFRFAAASGDKLVALVARRSGGSPCLQLTGPGGPFPRVCGGSYARVEENLANGMYSLIVTESLEGGNQAMDYTLTLERIAPTSPAASPICPGCGINDGMIEPVGDLDMAVFEGRAGDDVRVRAATQTGGAPCVELFRPDGTRVGSIECGGSGAEVVAILDQNGPHSILVSEGGNDLNLNYTLTYQCLGICPLPPPGLTCDIQMSQATYVDGDTVTASVLRLANHTAMTAPVELKIWLGLPGLPPASVANATLTLPPGFEQDFGPVPLFPVISALPRGSYEFSCRFLHPVTGGLLEVDLNPFQLQ